MLPFGQSTASQPGLFSPQGSLCGSRTVAAGRCLGVTGGCHPATEGSEWPEHHKSPVGNAVAPILQIERLRPREEPAPQSKSVSPQIQCSLHRGSSLEEGARVSAWGAGKGLQSQSAMRGSFPLCHPLSV